MSSFIPNPAIAHRLLDHARELSRAGGNVYKVQSYRRAAQVVRQARRNLAEQVRGGADLTEYPSIGPGIAAAIREIVFGGSPGQREFDFTSAPKSGRASSA